MANYRLAELDFDNIKINLKDFLKNYRDRDNNLVFSDYDFDASSISILLDMLAYNTHYNAYLSNMVANEMFLDSAVKRESAVSIAKHLGYVPLSFRSSRAKVSFTVPSPANTPATLTLPKFSTFTTSIDGIQYTFLNLDAVTTLPENNIYRFNDVEIVEGEALEFTYRVDISGPQEKYTIPNKNVDTSTIRVTVQNSYTDLTRTTYTLSTGITELTSESRIFFLEENPSGFFEVFFGDNVLGKKLAPGNLVTVEYLVSNGSRCNVSNNLEQYFTLTTPVGGVNLDTPILAVSNSTGGDEADSIEEIKFKAPKFRSSYNRAVTAEDYKAIIEANYPLVESVSVWGGEENIPPLYGKVIISLKPYLGYTISNELKTRITNEILATKKVMSIIPEFIDPNYLYIQLDTKVRFNSKTSRYNSQQIQSLVSLRIEDYFRLELQKFDRDFVYSRLSKSIDSVDTSIIGNITNIKVQKRIVPVVNALNGYTGPSVIKFVNTLISGSIESTAFFYDTGLEIKTVYMKDVLSDKNTSSIDLLDFFDNTVVVKDVGVVNYLQGTISIPRLDIAGYLENSSDVRIYSRIEGLDIQATKDVILVIDDSKQNSQLRQFSGLIITAIPE